MSDIINNIKNLRETTGAGFLDCKLALEQNNNEIQKSEYNWHISHSKTEYK